MELKTYLEGDHLLFTKGHFSSEESIGLHKVLADLDINKCIETWQETTGNIYSKNDQCWMTKEAQWIEAEPFVEYLVDMRIDEINVDIDDEDLIRSVDTIDPNNFKP